MHFSSWTLRSRLIALTVLLVAVTSVFVGGVMAFVIKQSFVANFDNQLANSVQGISRSLASSGQIASGQYGVEPGTIVAYYPTYATAAGVQFGTNDAVQLTQRQLQNVESSAGSDRLRTGAPAAFATGDVGPREYRFTTAPVGPGGSNGVLVVGKPTSLLNTEIAGVLAPVAAVVILAIVLAGLLAALIIGRALRPLRRVAAVASNVASLPLERGDVELPERVPEEDTNPHTEVGQVGSALNNLLDSVQSALEVRQASEEKVRNFVADASHELRTPLASIRGYAEITRRFGGDLSEDVQHNIGRIESEAQRMTSLVEDLLLLARLDAERELATTDVDLSRLLVDVVSDANAAGRDHEWELDIPDEPVIVRGDAAKLQQVFTNLVANARVHTPAGTRVVVELAEPRDGHVLARVRDDGPGIPEKLRPQLFGRFVRGDSSRARSTGSTGLGLSIVNAVVEAHHGTVSVASEPGTTIFTVQLPVQQPAEAKQPQPA
ncbi:sensor histidine kinase [Amnibacterium setariae]|uniref:histidine kinase n=1 Tax=Amnibacterium setariae TaxID=2306585 RepID=A0A3A1TWA3_9MICO|nr:HAMP domain-containing sensor histidine kinase [Amnibacterium setariae]RIX26418.1 sensor histidine kinase [Amnibacterium setariae]